MGTENYQKVSVAGLLIVENKALLVRRSAKEEFLAGYYELPGGKMETGEKPVQSLVREFMEEVSLKIKPLIPFRVFDYYIHKGSDHTIEIVYLVVLDQDRAENLKLSDEHDRFIWIGENETSKTNISDEIKQSLEEGFGINKKIF